MPKFRELPRRFGDDNNNPLPITMKEEYVREMAKKYLGMSEKDIDRANAQAVYYACMFAGQDETPKTKEVKATIAAIKIKAKVLYNILKKIDRPEEFFKIAIGLIEAGVKRGDLTTLRPVIEKSGAKGVAIRGSRSR